MTDTAPPALHDDAEKFAKWLDWARARLQAQRAGLGDVDAHRLLGLFDGRGASLAAANAEIERLTVKIEYEKENTRAAVVQANKLIGENRAACAEIERLRAEMNRLREDLISIWPDPEWIEDRSALVSPQHDAGLWGENKHTAALIKIALSPDSCEVERKIAMDALNWSDVPDAGTPSTTDVARARELVMQLMPEQVGLLDVVALNATAFALRAARQAGVREAAQWHEARERAIRDNPLGPEGLHTAIQGAHMVAHRESAEYFRAIAPSPKEKRDE